MKQEIIILLIDTN